MAERRFRKGFLLVLVVAISAAFLFVIRSFLVTILMAAIFSGLVYPFYRRVLHLFGGRAALASIVTVLLTLILVVGPLLMVAAVVAAEAVRVSDRVTTWAQQVQEPGAIDQLVRRIPFANRIEPYRAQIMERAGELAAAAGKGLVAILTSGTRSTLGFVFDFFMLLYTMFFLLMDGPRMLRTVKTYMPLRRLEQDRMLGKFVSVTRATLKGTLLIGVLQGGLSGIAFWVVGIQGALLWGVLMVILSVLPVVGGALVWVPAAIGLAITGHWPQAIGLVAFCSIVVGSIDNLLRPRLVGRDTELHDLLILFSTLGGIGVFGAVGFIIGPIVAALFVTIWEIFGGAWHAELGVHSPANDSVDTRG
jgi:predicted PurR-regulated permease PerM